MYSRHTQINRRRSEMDCSSMRKALALSLITMVFSGRRAGAVRSWARCSLRHGTRRFGGGGASRIRGGFQRFKRHQTHDGIHGSGCLYGARAGARSGLRHHRDAGRFQELGSEELRDPGRPDCGLQSGSRSWAYQHAGAGDGRSAAGGGHQDRSLAGCGEAPDRQSADQWPPR